MGPLAEEQLTYSAVGRFVFLDMSGPYYTKKDMEPEPQEQQPLSKKPGSDMEYASQATTPWYKSWKTIQQNPL